MNDIGKCRRHLKAKTSPPPSPLLTCAADNTTIYYRWWASHEREACACATRSCGTEARFACMTSSLARACCNLDGWTEQAARDNYTKQTPCKESTATTSTCAALEWRKPPVWDARLSAGRLGPSTSPPPATHRIPCARPS